MPNHADFFFNLDFFTVQHKLWDTDVTATVWLLYSSNKLLHLKCALSFMQTFIWRYIVYM